MNSEERRAMRRYPAQDGQDAAKLYVGNTQYEVRLVDESAGGFKIISDTSISVCIGQRGRIENHRGLFDVEVVHILRTDEAVQVGVKLAGAGGAVAASGSGKLTTKKQVLNWLGTAACLLFLVGGFMLVLTEAPRAVRSIWKGGPSVPRPSVVEGLVKQAPRVSELPGFDVIHSLSSFDVAKSLGLSNNQQQSLDRIFDESSRALAVLHEKAGTMPAQAWAKQSSKVVEITLQRVLCTLTKRQVEQLLTILTGAAPSDEALPSS